MYIVCIDGTHSNFSQYSFIAVILKIKHILLFIVF